MLEILTDGFPNFKKDSEDGFEFEPSSVPYGRAELGYCNDSSILGRGAVSPLTAMTRKATVRRSKLPPPSFLRVFIFNIFKIKKKKR